MDSSTERRPNELVFLQVNIEPTEIRLLSATRVIDAEKLPQIKPWQHKEASSVGATPLPWSAAWGDSTDPAPSIKLSSISVSLNSEEATPFTEPTKSDTSVSSPDQETRAAGHSPEKSNESTKKTTEVNDDGTIRVPSGSGYRIMTPFPWRLHEILEEVEQKRLDWIVSWLPNGRGFQVHCQKNFSEIIIPMFFRHCRYKSFQRQLYLYGFRSLETQNMSRGAYFHPKFVKSDRNLCRDIVRVKMETAQRSKKEGKQKRIPVTRKLKQQSRVVSHQSQQPWALQHQADQFSYDSSALSPRVDVTKDDAPTTSQPVQVGLWSGGDDLNAASMFSDHLLRYSKDIIDLFGLSSADGKDLSWDTHAYFQLAG
ncbi:HSF-type DNA-binding protein [Nitzschia inconspicua]|uniref:HSF-type DNA-binding protein n=1 Tax=Nitzschia inconspicua TaxID=303405 RepID=A0A9K3LR86_9STRA|nr:HSF-type DNA-binding protein [Nitzschia inconspicua]